MKVRTSLYLDKNVLRLAKENKINLSRFLEEKLKEEFKLNEECKEDSKKRGTRAFQALDPGSNPGRRILLFV